MSSRLRLILDAMVDRRLYGAIFFIRSFSLVVVGLAFQSIFYALISPAILAAYILENLIVVLFSALLAKNSRKEFHAMGWWLAYIFFITSFLAQAFALVASFEATPFGFLQIVISFFVPQTAYTISMMTIVVLGQRSSLRYSLGMSDDVFDNVKKRWKEELDTFPNSDNMARIFDEGKFVRNLFDQGFFNMTILWSCNIMGQIVDVATNEIILRRPDEGPLFRHEDGRRRPYPEQLNNLGYGLEETQKKILWHVWDVRNDVAHRSHRPTFDETSEALRTLISFTEEMPMVLKSWRPKATG